MGSIESQGWCQTNVSVSVCSSNQVWEPEEHIVEISSAVFPLTSPVAFLIHIRKFIVTDTAVGQTRAGIRPNPILSTPLHHSNLCLVKSHSGTFAARSKHVRGVCTPSKGTLNVISIAMFTVSRYFFDFRPIICKFSVEP